MSQYADVEIGLKREGDGYSVDLRFSQPGSDADVRLLRDERDEPVPLQFDFAALSRLMQDSKAYAELLGKSLWSEPLWTAFRLARANAESLKAPLRLRLFIDPNAKELHELKWETLLDPDTNGPLFTNENLLFSRYLSSNDLRPIDMRPMRDLKALVVIANPLNLSAWNFAPVDVAGELVRAKQSLGTIPVVDLCSDPAKPGTATLSNIATKLRDGYDILYLVCHGALREGQPLLYLEDDNEAKDKDGSDKLGMVKPVEAEEFATRLAELVQRPRLVVLASCQSAGDGAGNAEGPGGALTALGPRLADIGVPAVIAMQGKVTMATIEKFMPCFFEELRRDGEDGGQIDRAMSVARGKVRDHPDWWVPVLFMRLKSGRVGWYETGLRLGSEKDEADWWDALISQIEEKRCTPILGPGLLESLVGPSREIARRWGDEHEFPMAPNNRDDLPQIAQYVAITKKHKDVAFKELIKQFSQELLKRYGSQLPEELRARIKGRLSKAAAAQLLSELFSAVGELRREAQPDEPHRVFAELNLPIYISANPDNLLADALTKEGRAPQVEVCRWSNDLSEEVLATLPVVCRPTEEQPLVFHPFGHLRVPESMVLTLDDYLDYLIGVSKDKTRTPNTISAALSMSSLLFLGFQIDDWSFRVLFRSIVNQEGKDLRKNYTHVAVQIDPSSGTYIKPQEARDYFNSYFGVSDINIYWGSADDFAKDLHARWIQGA